MSAKNVWIAFGLGVSAGAAVALLYAPQSGARTRRQIKKNIDESVDYLEDAAGYLREQADYLSKEAQKTIKRTKGQVDDAVDKAAGVVTDAVKSVQALM
jgi:gas vesicle protein